MDSDKLKNILLASGENSDVCLKLYSWFEEKGVINKLRPYVRQQMMLSLKDSPTYDVNKSSSISPKLLAISMLVADFLMNQENVCTLSVFITEVPMLNNLREFNYYVNHLGRSENSVPIVKPRFQLNDVHEILEALGVQPNSDIIELICQHYFNDKNNHSLLACLFKAIAIVRNDISKFNEIRNNEDHLNRSTDIENNSYEHRLNSWLVSIEDILKSFNLNEGQRSILKKLLKQYHQSNNAQEVAVYKEHLKKLEKKFKETMERVTEVEQMTTDFRSRETGLIKQREQTEYITQQFHSESQQLHQLINTYEEKEKFMQEKLEDIENQKHELRLKEIELMRLREDSIKRMEATKIIESNQVKLLQEQNTNLTKQLQEIQLKLDELKECKKTEQTSPKKIDTTLHRIESSLDKEMVRKLQKENNELREFIKAQQQRIEELSQRASNLGKLHFQPLTATDYQTRNVKKKLSFVENPSHRNRYANQNISTTTTDYSTTLPESDNLTEDDIVQEAHSKWKTLVMKTAKVKQNLKNYQTNCMRYQSDNKSVSTNGLSYNEIRSNVSDDSDSSLLRNNTDKINLKVLANKIGYHRSVRRSMNLSPSKSDKSLEMLHNTRCQKHTDISPIKMLSSNANNRYRGESSENKPPISRLESPIHRVNDETEFSSHKSNGSPRLSRKSQLEIESTVLNRSSQETKTPELNNSKNYSQTTKLLDNVKIKNHKTSPKNSDSEKFKGSNDVQKSLNIQSFTDEEIIDLPQKKPTVKRDTLNEDAVDSSSSKKDRESEHTISFGSNRTDKSSDFWA